MPLLVRPREPATRGRQRLQEEGGLSQSPVHQRQKDLSGRPMQGRLEGARVRERVRGEVR